MIGKRIAEQRNLHGLNQEELAVKLNISQKSISKYERGDRRPSYEVLVAMASLFGVSVDYLLGRTDDHDDIEQEEPFYTNSKERKLIELYREYEDNKFPKSIVNGLKEFFPELELAEKLNPNEDKILSTFRCLNDDCQDIVIGKAKELLREQRYEETVAAEASMRKASGK